MHRGYYHHWKMMMSCTTNVATIASIVELHQQLLMMMLMTLEGQQDQYQLNSLISSMSFIGIVLGGPPDYPTPKKSTEILSPSFNPELQS
ncbi:hypothetical protein Q3G72_011554 [Acer saccharum]|nr:hypothetical protein Q3G72_011554 [Acer saccharum]